MDQLQSISARDFRSFLEQELSRRNSVNPNYSLRAFARDLGVDSSFLSKLLNGKRSMTARTILTLAPRLALPEEEVQDFIQRANGRRRRYSVGMQGIQTLQQIETHRLTEAMEWFHLAILELVGVKGFEATPAWISERLGISFEQAQTAFEELVHVGVLVQSPEGVWRSEANNHTICSRQFPRAQVVKKQIYEQAMALIPEDVGQHSAVTVSVSEDRLSEAQERIIRFRRELSHFLNEPEDKSQVYQLVISLFPVTR